MACIRRPNLHHLDNNLIQETVKQFLHIRIRIEHHVVTNHPSQQDCRPVNISQPLARNPHRLPRYLPPTLDHPDQVANTRLPPGDQSTLYNSRRFARDSFDKNRGVKAGSIEAEKAVEHAQGVAQILRENVVQGATDKEESGAYSESRPLLNLTTRIRRLTRPSRIRTAHSRANRKGRQRVCQAVQGNDKVFRRSQAMLPDLICKNI